MKTIRIILGSAALLACLAANAWPSIIFTPDPGYIASITVSPSGFMAGPGGGGMVVGNGTLLFDLPSTTMFVLTGSAPPGNYQQNLVGITANFSAGAPVSLEIDSPQCNLGALPGVCLQGTMSAGSSYAITFLSPPGAFNGAFSVVYFSPYILQLFGLNGYNPAGTIALGTANNVVDAPTFGPLPDGVTGDLAGGTITVPTVPEAGTLTLMGTGLLGLASAVRRRRS